MKAQLQDKFKRARGLFDHAGKIVYLNSAAFGPFCRPVRDAIETNIELRIAAEVDTDSHARAAADQLRSDYARMIGASKRAVGLGSSTSFGLSLAAFGLPLKRGDEILISDVEFPAIPYAFRAAAEARGLTLRYLKSRRGCFDADRFEKDIRRKSRLLALSSVQFFNGFKNDLRAISEVCKRRGLYLVVDGIQGAGVEPINVRKLGVDVFSSGCHKWLLSPHGSSFFYLSDDVRDSIVPPFMSWTSVDWQGNYSDLFYFDRPYYDSARRFEFGYDVVLNLLGMRAAVEIFKDLGVSNIQRHNYALIDRLADYIRSDAYYAITSFLTTRQRSSIFTFTCPLVKKLYDELLAKKIMVAFREGSIRVSVHLFNDEADIDCLIEHLADFSGRA